MIRSRVSIILCSVVVVAIAVSSAGWLAGTLIVGWYLAIAPGSAACRLLRVPRERAIGWTTVIAASFSIDAVFTELMVYTHTWTPLRGLVAIVILTALLVVIEATLTRRRHRARFSET